MSRESARSFRSLSHSLGRGTCSSEMEYIWNSNAATGLRALRQWRRNWLEVKLCMVEKREGCPSNCAEGAPHLQRFCCYEIMCISNWFRFTQWILRCVGGGAPCPPWTLLFDARHCKDPTYHNEFIENSSSRWTHCDTWLKVPALSTPQGFFGCRYSRKCLRSKKENTAEDSQRYLKVVKRGTNWDILRTKWTLRIANTFLSR